MTGLRWLALLGLAAALAFAFFLTTDGPKNTAGDTIPSAREGASDLGGNIELASLDDVDASDRAEVSNGVERVASAADTSAQPQKEGDALADAAAGGVRVELVGAGAGHLEAVLGDDFTIYGSADSFASASRVMPGLSEDGSYLFTGADASEVRWVGLQAKLFVDALVPVPALVEGETLTVELPVTRGISAAGVILDLSGQPIPSASVRLGSFERSDMASSIGFQEGTLTDEGGRFLVGGVLPGDATLRVNCEGYSIGKELLGSLQDGEFVEGVEIKLTAGGAVSGVVTWPDGSPAVKASVSVARVRSSWSNASKTKTDAEGAFEFTGLRGSAYRVVVRAKKKRSRSPWRAEGVADNGQHIQLELGAGLTLVGSAYDDAGQPLADFKVTAKPVGRDKGGDSGTAKVKKGDGTFEVKGLVAATYDVLVTAKGHTASRPVRVTLPGAGARADVVLQRLANAGGVVVDLDSQPIKDLSLRIAGKMVTSDKNGRFEVTGIDAGAVAVSLPHGTSGVVRNEPIVVDAGETRDDIVIVIGRGGTILCKLHPSLAGGIYTAATLRVENEFESTSKEFETEEGKEGMAEFTGLKAGTYWVALPTVKGREWVDTHRDTQPIPVEVPQDATVTVTIGDPDTYGIQVQGQVTREGELQSGLLMYVYGSGAEQSFPAAIARTDANGRYELRLRAPDQYAFNIGEGQTAQARFMVQVSDEANQERDFELPTAVLNGRATLADGTPPAGRMYVLVHADAALDTRQVGDLQFAMTGSDGTFSFTGLHPGRYRLHTGNYLSESDTDGLVVLEDIEVRAEGETPEVNMVIPRAAVLSLRAVDGEGRPLGAHKITLETPSGLPHLIYPRGKTDTQGYQRARGVGPGPWRVVVRDPAGRVVGREAIEVSEGELKEITVSCSV